MDKKRFKVLTNNPLVSAKLSDFNILFCDNIHEVYRFTRDHIHQNWRLTTHPLAGSVKPVQNPYRTIIIEKDDVISFQSLQIIENSLRKVEQFSVDHIERQYSTDILDDYQMIDLSLIESGLASI